MTDQAPEASEVLGEMPSWIARGLLYLLFLVVATVLIWAYFSPVDIVVTARGTIQGDKVEATVRNKDIGLIEPGLPAKLKIDAYPFQDFGVVPAKVIAIEPAGADYKVLLAPERTTIDFRGKPKQLLPGLALTADIVTDRRSLLSLMAAPFRRGRS
jgi:multidrug efflux pump subunit AcrA (membrane-fusion protein)